MEISEVLERRIAIFRAEHAWAITLDNRVLGEIILARDYKTRFDHGTSGHLPYTTINELLKVIESLENGVHN